MVCGCTNNVSNITNVDKKFLRLDAMKNLSIDEIVNLYRQGYRLENTSISETTILTKSNSNINVLTYGTQCSGGPDLDTGNNNTSVLQGTWGTVQRGRVWAQRFYANYRCLDFVQFYVQRVANINFYIEIRYDTGGLPQGTPLQNDSGLIYRTPSISYSEIPTSDWFYPTVATILPSTGTYYWICFVPVDFSDNPNYRSPICIGDPICDRFLIQDGTDLANKKSASYTNGSWTISSTYAFAVYVKPTFTEQCSTMSNVNANPTTALVGDSVSLGAQANPAGAYTVEFYDATTNTVLASKTETTPTSAYGALWSPTAAGVYQIKARVSGQCTSPGTTTVTINCSPAVSGVTANPTTVQTGQPVTLTSMVTPAGAYTVQFLDQNNNVIAFKTETTSTMTYTTTWTPSTAGTYALRAKLSTQPNSCANQPPEYVTATVSCAPVVATPTTVPLGSPVNLSMMVAPAGAYTVEFFNADNPTQVFATDTSTTSKGTYSANWTPSATGTYHVKGRISGQCESSTITTVTVNPACSSISNVTPTPSTVTINNQVTLNATVTPTGIYTVEFFNADNPTQVFATDTSTTSKSTYSATWIPNTAGIYHVKARVGTQCTSTTAATVTVNTAGGCTSMSNVIATPSIITVGTSTTLSANVTPTGTYTVEFFNADNPTQVFATDTSTTSKGTYSANWTPSATGTYHVKGRIGTQCISANITTVTVNPSGCTPLTVSVTCPTSPIDQNSTGNILANITGGSPGYVYKLFKNSDTVPMNIYPSIGKTSLTNHPFSHIFTESIGPHTFKVEVTDSCSPPQVVSNTCSVTIQQSTIPPPAAGGGGGMVIALIGAIAVAYLVMKPKVKPL